MSRFPRPLERAGLALALAVAVLVWWVTRTYPNYDSYYHLVWGRELVHGMAPSFEAYAAPTQHPLYVALGAVLGLVFGESADRALVLVCLLSHALLVFGTYRLGAAVFGRWSGALAALFVAASASFLLYAARGYVDSPFLAIVVWAGVFEAEGTRGESREWRPLALLVAAGLLRPEAWVLAGLWWLAAPPRRVRARGGRRAAHLGAHRPARHRRPAALAARHLRTRRRPRAGARRPARAGLVRVVHRRHRPPAGRAAGAGRRRARVALPRLARAARAARRCSPRA